MGSRASPVAGRRCRHWSNVSDPTSRSSANGRVGTPWTTPRRKSLMGTHERRAPCPMALLNREGKDPTATATAVIHDRGSLPVVGGWILQPGMPMRTLLPVRMQKAHPIMVVFLLAPKLVEGKRIIGFLF